MGSYDALVSVKCLLGLGMTYDLWDRVLGSGIEIWKGCEIPASGVRSSPQRNRNNIPDPLRAMPVKVSVKAGKISNYMTTRKSLERFGELRIVHERSGFGLDFVKKTEKGSRKTTPGREQSPRKGWIWELYLVSQLTRK